MYSRTSAFTLAPLRPKVGKIVVFIQTNNASWTHCHCTQKQSFAFAQITFPCHRIEKHQKLFWECLSPSAKVSFAGKE